MGLMTTLARLPARIAFSVALALVLHEAIEPGHRPALSMGRDDLEHALWAYVLTILGVAAFPRTRALLIALLLLGLSAVAEAIQTLVGRSAELNDWLSAVVGVAAAIAPMMLLWVRERLLRGRPSPADHS